jgi:DNA-nicking Smr family endonuclease
MFFLFRHDSQLDFHKYGLIDHFDVEQILSGFIEDEYISGNKALLIITGTGSMVKPTVAKLLKMNKFVKEFGEAGYFNGQKGAYEVILK